MFITSITSQVSTVSTAPAGTTVIRIWALTMLFALMSMLFALSISALVSEKHPLVKRLLHWVALMFFIGAIVAAGQTNLISNLSKGAEIGFTALLKTASVWFSDGDLTTSVIAFLMLVGCLIWYHKRLTEETDSLQFGLGSFIGILMIYLSQASGPARDFTNFILNTLVGGVMTGVMSFMGGGSVPIESPDSPLSVAVPTWFALTLFAFMAALLVVALNKKRGKTGNRWWLLALGLLAILSASQAPLIIYMTAAAENFTQAVNNGLSKDSIQSTTGWTALIILGICLMIFGATHNEKMVGRFKEGSKAPVRIRYGMIVLIPLMLIIMVQSYPEAFHASKVYVDSGTKILGLFVGFLEVI